MSVSSPRLVVALDFDNPRDCLDLVARLNPASCRLKVGKQLFTIAGPSLIESLINKGFDVFLDLKYHDIPTTVAKAISASCDLGVWMVNVHGCGGRRMLEAAREAVLKSSHSPLLIGVTALTSLEPQDLLAIGVSMQLDDYVLTLASLAKDSGLDGVVCSAREAPLLRDKLGADFCLVTPGIRLQALSGQQGSDDQRRVVTPVQAVEQGSHYIVVGRPITQASDPVAICSSINESLIGQDVIV